MSEHEKFSSSDTFYDRNSHAQIKIDALNKEYILENLETMNELRSRRDILSLKKEIDNLESHAENAEIERKRYSLKIEFDMMDQDHRNKKQKLEQSIELLKLEKDKSEILYELEKQRMTHRSDLINAELNMREKELAYKEWAGQDALRIQNPIVATHNKLKEIIVSDRIIDLNGTIMYKTADYITTRLNYYNNQSITDPIFLVIGNSPGGSVMAGLEILANIENSRAPVYTIIKSFAASMAAVIATRTNSYMYKDANILHHEMWCGTIGSSSWHKEQMQFLDNLTKRTDGPMLQKINGRLMRRAFESDSESDTESYTCSEASSEQEHSSEQKPKKPAKPDIKLWTPDDWKNAINTKSLSHEWMVHGNEAEELGWIEGCVDFIRFTSQVRHPDAKYSVEKPIPPAPSPPPAPCKSNQMIEYENEILRIDDYMYHYHYRNGQKIKFN